MPSVGVSLDPPHRRRTLHKEQHSKVRVWREDCEGTATTSLAFIPSRVAGNRHQLAELHLFLQTTTMAAAGLSSKWITVSEPVPHVLHIELARKPVNAFSNEYWRAYGALFQRLATEGRDVRVAVVSSRIAKMFTAGIDFAAAGDIAQGGLSDVEALDGARASLSFHADIEEYQRAIGSPQRCSFPVIVAVHGLVLGLGVDIVSACDIRYAAETAQFSIKEVDIGLAADVGSLAFLPKVVGNHSMLHEFAYSTKLFSAADALQMGLVSRVVPGNRDEVVRAALELATLIATKSPVAVSGTKRILNHSRDHSVAENLEYTAAWNAAALRTQDIPESLLAAREKRSTKFAPLRKPPARL
uniref:Delta-2 dienoyl-CoA isomerase n=1 Tax=Mycena chlorophos TaxID=658473 RepID=A0ABQ0L7U6_MYCCL|nr:delta-2 dienoyl-CoA isomerase [Mycena chlorophos]